MANTQGVNRIISSSLTLVAGVAGLASFDTPAIITDDAPISGFTGVRAKIYGVDELATVATEFGSGTATYKAAAAIVAQSPTVDQFVIIKRDSAVATVQTVTWSGDFGAGETITGLVNGDAISVAWNTDNATTMGDLNTAIAAAYGIDTSTGAVNTNTVTADAEYPLSISLTAAGGNAPTATVATTVSGRSIQDDIADALLEPTTAIWYTLYYCGSSEGAMLNGAAKAETETMLFAVQSNGATVKTSATDDVMSRLQDSAYRRTFGTYRGTLTDHANAALFGRVLAADPGSITFWHRTLSGVVADDLTTSEIGFIEGKDCNNYANIANTGRFEPGVTFDGNSIQLTRDLDYMMNEITEELLAMITSRNKTPFDASGQVLIESTIDGTLSRMVQEDVLASGYTLTVPAPSAVNSSDKANHLWSGITIDGAYNDGVRKISFSATIEV